MFGIMPPSPKNFQFSIFFCKLLSKSLSKINEGNYPVDDEKMKTKIPQEIAILNEQFWWILHLVVSLLKWKKKKKEISKLWMTCMNSGYHFIFYFNTSIKKKEIPLVLLTYYHWHEKYEKSDLTVHNNLCFRCSCRLW